MVQLLLRGFGSGTTVVHVPTLTNSVELLKECIQGATGIPVEYQGLVYSGRQLCDGEALSAYCIQAGSTVQLVYRLLGGKGGFGALLRGLGRDGKITENFDACRDLHGRRVRHTTAEQKLSEWRSHAKERELEKVAQQHIKELARQSRKENIEEVDVEAFRSEQQAAIDRTQAAVQDVLRDLSAAGTSVAGKPSSKGTASHSKPSSTCSQPSTSITTAAAAGDVTGGAVTGKRSSPEAAAKPIAKKPKMLAMLEDVSSDGDSTDSEVAQ